MLQLLRGRIMVSICHNNLSLVRFRILVTNILFHRNDQGLHMEGQEAELLCNFLKAAHGPRHVLLIQQREG